VGEVNDRQKQAFLGGAAAIQVKLDELIRVSKAQNSFIGLEHLTEEELEEIRRRCEEAAKAKVKAGRRRA
jgi:low affinity Fe/Cu permease